MSRDEIINMVMIRMDEVTPFEEGAMVTSPLIASLLQEAANNIVLTFPSHLFTPLLQAPGLYEPVLFVKEDGSGSIRIWEEFLKFVSLRIIGWERPVTTLSSTSDPIYSLQSDPYLRGNPSRPLAFKTSIKGHKSIEYFSLPKGVTHELDHFQWIAEKKPEDIPDKLLSALAWETAKLAFMALQDPNGATISANNVQQQQMQFQQ